jgi:hypothetical protein
MPLLADPALRIVVSVILARETLGGNCNCNPNTTDIDESCEADDYL